MRLAAALLLFAAVPAGAATPLDGAWTVDLSAKPGEGLKMLAKVSLEAENTRPQLRHLDESRGLLRRAKLGGAGRSVTAR